MLLRLTAVATLLWGFAPFQIYADEFDDIRKQIRRSLVEQQVPSLAVAVAKDGKILWEEGFGWADREHRIRATPNTMYSLASISKPITATGIMVLAQKGLVDLDQPVNDYLGDAQVRARIGDAKGATLRRLANHTSGLPLHYQFFYADQPFRRPPMAESIRRYGQLHAPPGERYQYANFGFGLLDHVIARISNQSYADFMKREVFAPLDLPHMSVDIPPQHQHGHAVRYGSDQQPIPFYEFDHPGASAVYSSAHDLVRFGMFHLNQRAPEQKELLPKRVIEAMQKPTADTGRGRGYGVGWFVNSDEFGVRTVSHSGGMGGVRTRLVLVPEKKIAVVTLCNFSTNLPMKIAERILGVLIPEYEKRRTQQERRQREHPPSPPRKTSPTSQKMLGHWSGAVHTHEGKRPLDLWIKKSGDGHLQLDGQLKTLLNEARLVNGELRGKFAGDIRTSDANRRPYHLHLRLKLRGDRMNGSVAAISLPDARIGNALSHWVELKRDTGESVLFDGKSLKGWRIVTKYDFVRHGRAHVQDGTLVLERGKPATGVSWTGNLPRSNYEIDLEAKRVAGDDFFCGLTFPVRQSFCTLIVGGWGGGVTGLSNIDDQSAVENLTTGYTEFKKNRWYRIRLRVEHDRIQAWIDKEQIVSVETKGRRFSIWWEQEPVRPLGIASWYTKTALRNIKVRRLNAPTNMP